MKEYLDFSKGPLPDKRRQVRDGRRGEFVGRLRDTLPQRLVNNKIL